MSSVPSAAAAAAVAAASAASALERSLVVKEEAVATYPPRRKRAAAAASSAAVAAAAADVDDDNDDNYNYNGDDMVDSKMKQKCPLCEKKQTAEKMISHLQVCVNSNPIYALKFIRLRLIKDRNKPDTLDLIDSFAENKVSDEKILLVNGRNEYFQKLLFEHYAKFNESEYDIRSVHKMSEPAFLRYLCSLCDPSVDEIKNERKLFAVVCESHDLNGDLRILFSQLVGYIEDRNVLFNHYKLSVWIKFLIRVSKFVCLFDSWLAKLGNVSFFVLSIVKNMVIRKSRSRNGRAYKPSFCFDLFNQSSFLGSISRNG